MSTVAEPDRPTFNEAELSSRTPKSRRAIRIASRAATGLFAAMMTFSGILFVLGPKPIAEGIHHLGYPPYFAALLGVAKLLGVMALLAPRMGTLREWAYAGFTFVLVAALLSHALAGDGPGRAVPAAFNLGLLLASYFLRRRAAAMGVGPSRVPAPSTMQPSSGQLASAGPVLRHSLWFGRLVLVGAVILFSLIALRQIADPIGASAPHQISLGSSDAITITRVMGATFLGLALVLAACIVPERRLLTGLGVLVTIITAVTAVRVLGLILDGPAPFTLKVLKPEVVLVVLSSTAFFAERRRRRRVSAPLGPGDAGVLA